MSKQLAQQLHSYGLRVFPVTANKRPAVKGWQFPKTPDEYQWTSGRVGIPIPAGCFVIDLDKYKGITRETVERVLGCALPWDDALIQITAKGGEHYAFSHNGDELVQGANLFKTDGFDTRRAGAGFIVTGEGYTINRFGPVAMVYPGTLPPLPPPAALRLRKPERQAEKPTKPLTEQEVENMKSALSAIDPACGRDDWWRLLAAARHLTAEDPERGLEIFNEWSAGEYSQSQEPPANYMSFDDVEHQWFHTGSDGGIAGGTLYHKAMEHGWRPPASFDVSAVFGKGAAPVDVYAQLIDDIMEHASNAKETPRLMELVLAFQGSRVQSAALKATLQNNLKEAGLLSKALKSQLDGAGFEKPKPVPTAPGELVPSHLPLDPSMWASFQTKGKENKPKGTLDNFRIMMAAYGVRIHFDEVRKELSIDGPGVPSKGILHDESALAYIDHLANLNDYPKADNRAMIMVLAGENMVNPIINYINSRPWDGHDYIGQLFSCLTLDEHEDAYMAEQLFRRWFLGAVAIGTGRTKAMEYVLTLVDPTGGAGKTRFFCSLVPEDLRKDSVTLDATDRDSVKVATSYWLVELGELDGTFSKSEASRLKAFLSSEYDEMRMAYGRSYMKYPRRTAFFASVNSAAFLPDSSGNRRFWPIRVTATNHDHGIDVQQAWAQAQDELNRGFRWFLTSEENRLITERNEGFRALSRAVDVLSTIFDATKPANVHMTVTGALARAGFPNPTKNDLNEGARWLRAQGFEECKRNGLRGFMVPLYDINTPPEAPGIAQQVFSKPQDAQQ